MSWRTRFGNVNSLPHQTWPPDHALQGEHMVLKQLNTTITKSIVSIKEATLSSQKCSDFNSNKLSKYIQHYYSQAF